jgi:hypothetical protein
LRVLSNERFEIRETLAMHTARPALRAAAVTLLSLLAPLAPVRAEGGASGTYALDASTVFPVADAVAFHRPSWAGNRLIVLLAMEPLDRAAWEATLDPAGLAERFHDEASWIELELEPDGTWAGTSFGLRHDGGSSSGSQYDAAGAESMKATIGDGRVTGRLQAAFANGSTVDLTLAAPLLAPTGEPLPDDGGEPATSLRACNTAFAARDLPRVERACETSTSEIIASAVRMRAEGYEMEDPWTAAGASECNVAAVTDLTIGGGVVRGDEARVEATGGWTEDRRCAGSVYLRREGGKWRISRSALALAF